MNKLQTKKGFTIIEVVLVLAIAGLIFLMVFLALPSLQRSQRDTQRKNDLSRVQSAINSYQSNNRGQIPTVEQANNALKNGYLKANNDQFKDPNGKEYEFTATDPQGNYNSNTENSNKVQYAIGSVCNGESLTAGQGNRKVALRMQLEGGGTYCLNN